MVPARRGERTTVRRQVDFLVRVLFPTRGLSQVRDARLRLKDLSEGGAALLTAGLKGIPDFFYLQFGDEKSELFGCYVVGRSPDTIHCQFSTAFPTSTIERIIMEQEALAFLDQLAEQATGDLFDDLSLLVNTAPAPEGWA